MGLSVLNVMMTENRADISLDTVLCCDVWKVDMYVMIHLCDRSDLCFRVVDLL